MPDERPPEAIITVAGVRTTLPNTALMLMLMGIMVPPVFHAIRLTAPTPTQVITAICISVFAGVLYLWILDATAVFRFRSVWMSRSIYTIGIGSIITASVGIYKDAFTEHLHPLDGNWRVSAWTGTGECIADNEQCIFYFSRAAQTYQGYSDYHEDWRETNHIRHIRVDRFEPETGLMTLRVLRDKPQTFQFKNVNVSRNQAVISASENVTNQIVSVSADGQSIATNYSVKSDSFVFNRP